MSVTDQRDGATEEFQQHFDTRKRRSGEGEVVFTRLEQLLENDDIKAVQSEAGRRWARDFLICFGGSGRSCLDITPKGNGGWNPSEAREDAAKAYLAARVALDGSKSPASGMTPSQVVTMCVVDDAPFEHVGLCLGVSKYLAKRAIAEHLQVLADHYASEDKRVGRNSTAQTKEAAIARFEPEVAPRRPS